MKSLSLAFEVPPSLIEEYACEVYSELIGSQFSDDVIAFSGLLPEEFIDALTKDSRFHRYLKHAALNIGSSYFFEKVYSTVGDTIYEYELTEKIPEIARLMDWLIEIEDTLRDAEKAQVTHAKSGLSADEEGISVAKEFLESLGYKVTKPRSK
jgi:hypothetical protein